MAINIKFLKHFEEYLKVNSYTNTDNLTKLSNSSIIIHYKKLIEIAIKNDMSGEPEPMLFSWVVNFLLSMSSYKISIKVVLDGVKPKLLAENFDLSTEVQAKCEPSWLYNYTNLGVDEIIEAIKVLKDAGYAHSYFIAPYEATPQVYYLHDNFLGSSLWGYPDLLMYTWYNYIMDINTIDGSFEWVIYKRNHKLNENKSLYKIFVKNGYYLARDQKYKPITFDELKSQLEAINGPEDRFRIDPRLDGLAYLVSKACYLSSSFRIEKFKDEKCELNSDFLSCYGKMLGNLVLVSLFRGLLSPKVCENLSNSAVFTPSQILHTEMEQQYIRFNEKMNDTARKTIDKEDAKAEELKKTTQDNTADSMDENDKTNDYTTTDSIIKFIHSKVISDGIHELAEARIKTVNFIWVYFQKYLEDSTPEQTYTEDSLYLRENQIMPFLLTHLCKEIGFIDNNGLTDMGKYFSSHSDWNHDQHIIMIMIMIKIGMPVDFSTISNVKNEAIDTLELNAVNLWWAVISLLDVKIGEPWEPFEIEADETLKKFNILSELTRDGINNYLECLLNAGYMVSSHSELGDKWRKTQNRLYDYKLYDKIYNTIEFKRSQGIYFASLLKSVLLYNFPSDDSPDSKLNSTNWPWVKNISIGNFKDILKKALTLWDSVYKMVSELTEKSRIQHLNTAFSNADYILKSKIMQLGLIELF